MHNLIIPILIITLIISIFISIKSNCKYFVEKYRYKEFKKNIEKEYIKKDDIVLRNAVYEALVQAREKHNYFEERAYKKLLAELKKR